MLNEVPLICLFLDHNTYLVSIIDNNNLCLMKDNSTVTLEAQNTSNTTGKFY